MPQDRGWLDVVAAVIWREGRFLAVRRPPGARMAGYWEFPGGKVEPGEAPRAALARELDEELGLACGRCRFWREVRHDYGGLKVRLLFYHACEPSGDPVAREGQEMAWIMPGEACTLDFLPADEPVLADLMQPRAQGDDPCVSQSR
ncbi:(deoxy)nucleoside triphosphate pyrophosphohydrolase [Desulfohalovibrio reitneri]|uniref:(deoxy)nucleoside triphosphate pyrophosphohydrolase n=1 Tax=Desulfohalovibrio reitneri TaxID=1307759 RepID=UPI0004A727AE|nr:(deoxy)nucleoside triphosphate pyrophosphohydrolase [Desulfohalovibrio reitneri]